MEQLGGVPNRRRQFGGSYLGERMVGLLRRGVLVFEEALGTGELWGSVPLSWEVSGERYKRLGFDDPPPNLGFEDLLSQENLGLSPWALLTRTSACSKEHVQGC